MNEEILIIQRARGFVNLALLLGLYFIIGYYLIEDIWISSLLSLGIGFITFLITNKKWFKKIAFSNYGINVVYYYNLFGKKNFKWDYSHIEKVI
jgi:hypothetical protein